jgi:hypothetical protein
MQLQAGGLAQWIWSNGEESPRNEWRCFRKSFEVPAAGWDSSKIAITADSRYVLPFASAWLLRIDAEADRRAQYYAYFR